MKNKKIFKSISAVISIFVLIVLFILIFFSQDKVISLPFSNKTIEFNQPNYLFLSYRCIAAPGCNNPTDSYYSYFQLPFLKTDWMPYGFEFTGGLNKVMSDQDYKTYINQMRGIFLKPDSVPNSEGVFTTYSKNDNTYGEMSSAYKCLTYEKININNLEGVDHIFGNYTCDSSDPTQYFIDDYIYRDKQTHEIMELKFKDSNSSNSGVIKHILSTWRIV